MDLLDIQPLKIRVLLNEKPSNHADFKSPHAVSLIHPAESSPKTHQFMWSTSTCSRANNNLLRGGASGVTGQIQVAFPNSFEWLSMRGLTVRERQHRLGSDCNNPWCLNVVGKGQVDLASREGCFMLWDSDLEFRNKWTQQVVFREK